MPKTPWGINTDRSYRIIARKMLNISGERTLIAIMPPFGTGHIHGLFGISFLNLAIAIQELALCASLPYDFFVKVLGKSNLQSDAIQRFPVFDINNEIVRELCTRGMMLNCISQNYSDLWTQSFVYMNVDTNWTKCDHRLNDKKFSNLAEQWDSNVILKTDYERRQALVEIDVLVSMLMGMSLSQLKTIYNIQFPVLQSYEADTWYDANGRIVFTPNRSMVGVGYDRKIWEYEVKDAPIGKKFYRTIIDDTMPGGPVKRTIEYVAPFDRCDRDRDYETAWKFFKEKYKK